MPLVWVVRFPAPARARGTSFKIGSFDCSDYLDMCTDATLSVTTTGISKTFRSSHVIDFLSCTWPRRPRFLRLAQSGG